MWVGREGAGLNEIWRNTAVCGESPLVINYRSFLRSVDRMVRFFGSVLFYSVLFQMLVKTEMTFFLLLAPVDVQTSLVSFFVGQTKNHFFISERLLRNDFFNQIELVRIRLISFSLPGRHFELGWETSFVRKKWTNRSISYIFFLSFLLLLLISPWCYFAKEEERERKREKQKKNSKQ